MAIQLNKKSGEYISQEFINNKTLLNEANVKPINENLAEVSSHAVNSMVSTGIKTSDWVKRVVNFNGSQVEEFYIIVNHNWNSQLFNASFMTADGALFIATKAISNTQLEIVSDEVYAGNLTIAFDIA